MLSKLRKLLLGICFVGCGGEGECLEGCRSLVEFVLETPVSADDLQITLTPGALSVSCSRVAAEAMECVAQSSAVNVVLGPDGAVEKIHWYGPPAHTTLSVIVEADGNIIAEGMFPYDPELDSETCGGRCYETESFSLR